MKNKILALFAVHAAAVCAFLSLPACTSTPAAAVSAPDLAVASIQPVAKNVVNAVLLKNPGYAPALLAIADGADAALEGAPLTPATITAFVNAIGQKYSLDPQAQLLVASGIDDLVHLYQATYGAQVANATDPNVKRFLTAFAAGIRDGVAFHQAFLGTGTGIAISGTVTLPSGK